MMTFLLLANTVIDTDFYLFVCRNVYIPVINKEVNTSVYKQQKNRANIFA